MGERVEEEPRNNYRRIRWTIGTEGYTVSTRRGCSLMSPRKAPLLEEISCDWPSGKPSLARKPAKVEKKSIMEIHEHYFPTVNTTTDTMVVKIRLARFGKRKAPFYNIVVAHARFVGSKKEISTILTQKQDRQEQQADRGLGYVIWGQIAPKNEQFEKPADVSLVGTYDPIPKAPVEGEGKPFKDIKLDTVRAKYWLGVGAQPSDPAWRLLSMVFGILLRSVPHILISISQVGLVEPKLREGYANTTTGAISDQKTVV
jgi:small subunit ribosomal protein S16